jgi:predicted permease
VTRVIDRGRELAVRASLGATRRHLIAQLALEAALLVAVGSGIGVAASRLVLRGFLAASPVALPSYLTLEPDGGALAIATAVLALAGLFAGIVPALLGSRVAPGEAMRAGGRGTIGGRGERRWGAVLVIVETAATVVLVVTGALLLRSWQQLETADLGYRVERIARLAFTINRLDAAAPADVPAVIERVREAVASHPEAMRVGLVWPTLPPWDPGRTRVRSPLLAPAELETGLDAGAHVADAGFFDVLEIPLIEGRMFRAGDARSAIISRGLADRLGGAQATVDREISLQSDDMSLPAGTFRIVGVVGDVAYDGLAEQDTRRYISYRSAADPRAARYDVYLPIAAFPSRQISIGVLTRGDEAAAVEPLRRAIAGVVPASAVHWTGTMADELGIEYASSRFYAVLVASFSASALLLTAVGVFAVLSHGVARRTPEIGLRVALGATPQAIARLVASSGLLPLSAGLAIGFMLAVVAARSLGGVLYETPTLDPVAFSGAAALLLAAGLAALSLPMRRAARVDPLVALRE